LEDTPAAKSEWEWREVYPVQQLNNQWQVALNASSYSPIDIHIGFMNEKLIGVEHIISL